ncbi:MAG: methylmalonyl Co-A mutase-associated GTPase MeaB [Bacteroidales bacterium]|nr:methylmalonyl Co-A mutase-associated GTPase MeaB [Bacteroidales bacterium]MBP5396686.1 methylmalonyl Co-A mutase-associated GTPase MeaB [Bacteroidales bacterium]
MENIVNDIQSALHVNDGIPQPAKVNPYLKQRPLKRAALRSTAEYVEGILAHNRVVLSQAITLIESNLHEHYTQAQEIINACIPFSGNSVRIGITGVPGAGKSTFIESFGNYVTGQGHRLAVLAVDPSSEISKGSILGDKTRMETLSVNPDAFIRPSPSAGSLGGVARKTRESIILCEAAGFDTILVETVGVGQSETAVHSMVDFFLLVTIAGAGDELQGIKRGIMEMANAIVVNKADGDNRKRAELTRRQLANALQLFPNHNQPSWKTPVLTASALDGTSIPEIWEMINGYVARMRANGEFGKRRIRQSEECLKSYIEERLFDRFYSNGAVRSVWDDLRRQMLEQKISAYAAGSRLMDVFNSSSNS